MMMLGSLSSIFSDYLQWSKFFETAIKHYRLLTYPIYSFLSSIIHLDIPFVVRDIYTISYLLTVSAILAVGKGGGFAQILRLAWESAPGEADSSALLRRTSARVTLTLALSFIFALLTPAFVFALFIHSGTRAVAIDAIRIFGQSVVALFCLCVLSFYVEFIYANWSPGSTALTSLAADTHAQIFMAINVAAFASIAVVILVRRALNRQPISLRISDLFLFDYVGDLERSVLFTDFPLCHTIKYAIFRATNHLEFITDEGRRLDLGLPFKGSLGPLFSNRTLILIQMTDGTMKYASEITVVQASRITNRITQSVITGIQPPIRSLPADYVQGVVNKLQDSRDRKEKTKNRTAA